MTIDEMIAVLQAAKAGKQIERRLQGCKSWQDVSGVEFHCFDYRVKPEPREWTVEVGPSGSIMSHWGGGYERVKVREVL